jgi:hypothetical protein
MAGVSDADLERAEVRGEAMLDRAPRASLARYDAATGRVTVELVNGCSHAFPAERVQDLRGASHEALGDIEVDGLGLNLRFPTLGVDLFVPALVSGVFGTSAWMTRELARIAGQKTSAAKAAAARANGAKGGRPRKAAVG